jgi:hypothetical protein
LSSHCSKGLGTEPFVPREFALRLLQLFIAYCAIDHAGIAFDFAAFLARDTEVV